MVGLGDIRKARERVAGVALRTPVLPVKFSGRPEVFMKCENLQRGGSFKIRGAYNKISRLGKVKGVTAHSSGNHAQAVAIAAGLLGIPAKIVMLGGAMKHKLEATRGYGAEVILGGETSLAIMERAHRLVEEEGFSIVYPFNDPLIVAGAGTAGLEILEDLPDVRAVVVPIGGGGLCSGIVTAIKELKPDVKVFGVEPEGAPGMSRSVEAGEVVVLPGVDTIADGLKPVRVGDVTFPIIRKYVDGLVLVNDGQIMETARHLILKEKLVVEPSGAAALAAIRHGRIDLPDGPAVAVLSGGNADIPMILGWDG
ncbi:MAG: threonine ammonia-lyase [Planctomycetota bacterium]|jgi:threonine dehydratase